MKQLFALLPLLFVLTCFSACDDDPTAPAEGWATLRGQVRIEDGSPARYMKVYAAREYEIVKNAPGGSKSLAVIDSTTANSHGVFDLDIEEYARYRIYAEGSDSFDVLPAETWFVSPFSDQISYNPETGEPPAVNLTVVEELDDGRIEGRIMREGDLGEVVPGESATVILYPIRGCNRAASDTVYSDVEGYFAFDSVSTRNYFIGAHLEFETGGGGPLFCDGESTLDLGDVYITSLHAAKPAVYIYPAEAGDFTVLLEPAVHTVITRTIPDYGDGWNVSVDTDGRIDGTWDYLFYETDQGWAHTLREGVCLSRADLAEGLADLLERAGLVEAEIVEFLDYWLPRLQDSPYYGVYPVLNERIDSVIGLRVVPPADATLRVWVYFKGGSAPLGLPDPQLAPFERGATTVVEWGGVLLD